MNQKQIKLPQEILFKAIEENNFALFNQVISLEGIDIVKARAVKRDYHKNRLFFTRLFMAADVGSIEIVKSLLDVRGINIDEKVLTQHHIPAVCQEISQTPLGIAIQNGHLDIVKFLLARKANPDCFYWDSPNPRVTHVVNMYKYRMIITDELNDFWYQSIVLPIKNSITFFKEEFPQEKVVKLEVANLIIEVFEGKRDARVLNELTDKQVLAIEGGRLKKVFEDIKSQLPKVNYKPVSNIG